MTTDARHDEIVIEPAAPIAEADVLDALLDDAHPVKTEAAEWARANLDDPDLEARDLACEFWDQGWQRLVDRDAVGLLVDPAYGGRGASLVDTLLTIEGLGLGTRDDGLILALSTQVLTMQLTLERFGTDEQKAAWLPELIAGRAFGAFCMSELEAGSDAFSLSTTATPTPDGFRLDGSKAWVTMAPRADVFIVFASTDPEAGRWGLSVFLVPADTPGLTVGPNRPKMGLRTTPFADVTLDGCELPTSALIGKPGAGASIFSSAMEAERAFVLVGAVGALERTIDDALRFAQTREQFGQPIGTFQAISHAAADMKLGHEAARTLLYKAAALHQGGTPSMLAAALAKLAASEAALHGALAAVRIHGARGYVTEFGVERDLRNSVGGVIYGGSSSIQKNIVARLIGLPR